MVVRDAVGLARRVFRLSATAKARPAGAGEPCAAGAHPDRVCAEPADVWQPAFCPGTRSSHQPQPHRPSEAAGSSVGPPAPQIPHGHDRTSLHADPIALNRLRATTPTRSDQVWVTDATALLTGQEWQYAVALLDVYTRRIVAGPCMKAWTPRSPSKLPDGHRTAPAATGSDRALRPGHLVCQRLGSAGAGRHPRQSPLRRLAILDCNEAFRNRTQLHSGLGYLCLNVPEPELKN